MTRTGFLNALECDVFAPQGGLDFDLPPIICLASHFCIVFLASLLQPLYRLTVSEPVTGCGLATDVSLHPEVVSSASLERMSGR